jgi:peroxiredoxin
VRVVACFLARVKVFGFEQTLGAFKLFVCEIIAVVKVRDLIVDGAWRRALSGVVCAMMLIGPTLRCVK